MRRFVLLLVILCAARASLACSCLQQPVDAHIADAEWISAGRVIAIEQTASGRLVTFEVTRLWKGGSARTVEILTGNGGGDCGYDFELDYSYVVFVSQQQGRLQTGICTANAPLLCARDTLAALGDTDFEVPDEEPYPTGRFGCITPPQPLSEYRPERAVTGRSIAVNLVVDREGRVTKVTFAEKDGCSDCSDETKRAIEARARELRFRPATHEGRPIAVRIRQQAPRPSPTKSEAKENECH